MSDLHSAEATYSAPTLADCKAAPGFGICMIQDPCAVHNCGVDGTCGCTGPDGEPVEV